MSVNSTFVLTGRRLPEAVFPGVLTTLLEFILFLADATGATLFHFPTRDSSIRNH